METRNDLNEETIEKLQRLIQANLDSYQGYKDAAEDVRNARLRQLFSTAICGQATPLSRPTVNLSFSIQPLTTATQKPT